MNKLRPIYFIFIVALLLFFSFTLIPGVFDSTVMAQGPVPTLPTIEGPQPPPPPVPIPEPITVVLFGTGLAALSAAAASRRKKDDVE